MNAADPGCAPTKGITWGIRRSFIRYIAGLPDAAHLLDGGAYLSESSYFTYPVEAVTDTGGASVVASRGSLRIRAHGGLLDVLIADPWIEFAATGVVLSVVDPTGWPHRDRRLALATLTALPDRGEIRSGQRFAATLTEAGTAVFGGNYEQGIDLDPVLLD